MKTNGRIFVTAMARNLSPLFRVGAPARAAVGGM